MTCWCWSKGKTHQYKRRGALYDEAAGGAVPAGDGVLVDIWRGGSHGAGGL